MVLIVDEEVPTGDLEAGDLIALPDEAGQFLIRTVRLGHGGFILTVAPAGGSAPGPERQVTLTAAAQVRKLGRAHVL